MHDYYVERLNEVRNMSCKPEGISLVRDGHIFDGDKSVKWNREQITKNNQKYQDEVKRLNQEKMQTREEVYSDFYKDILESLSIATGGKKFSTGRQRLFGNIWKVICKIVMISHPHWMS